MIVFATGASLLIFICINVLLDDLVSSLLDRLQLDLLLRVLLHFFFASLAALGTMNYP